MTYRHFGDHLCLSVPVANSQRGANVTINGQDRSYGSGPCDKVNLARYVGRLRVVFRGGVAMIEPVTEINVVSARVGSGGVSYGVRYFPVFFLSNVETVSLVGRNDTEFPRILSFVAFSRRLLRLREVELYYAIEWSYAVNGAISCAYGLCPLLNERRPAGRRASRW